MRWLLRTATAILGVLAVLGAVGVAPAAADTPEMSMWSVGDLNHHSRTYYPDGSWAGELYNATGFAYRGVSGTTQAPAFWASIDRSRFDAKSGVTTHSSTGFNATSTTASKYDPKLETLSFTGQGTWTSTVWTDGDDTVYQSSGDGTFAVTYTGTGPLSVQRSATVYDPGSVTLIAMGDATRRNCTVSGSLLGEPIPNNTEDETALWNARSVVVVPAHQQPA